MTLADIARDSDGKGHRAGPIPPEPSRVLFLATSAGNGGIERHSAWLAARLREQGVPLAFVCRPGTFLETACAAQNIPVHSLRVRNSGDPGAVLHLIVLIRAFRADILHVHSRRDFLPAAIAVAWLRSGRRQSGAGLSGFPAPALVLHAHLDKPLGLPPRLSGRVLGRTAQAIVAVSEAVRQTLLQAHSLPPALVHVLPNCLDALRFAVPGDPSAALWRRAMRGRWNIPQDAPVVGMVGRLSDKGQAGLIALAPRLLRQHPNLRFVFIGPDGSREVRQSLEAVVAAFGLQDRVVFAGESEEVPAAMAALDVLAHFPRSEAFGLVLLEAMASGLPVVASRVGGCGEVVADSVTGLLVPPNDAEARFSVLSFLLEAEGGVNRRAALGAAGRERVISCFSPAQETAAVQSLYQDLRRNKGAAK